MASSQLVHINAGNGEYSYASNSTVQKRIIEEAKPVLEDAIKQMFKNNIIVEFPKSCFNMADLGCSSGPNTLFTISNIINIVQVLCDEKRCKMPEFQAYLNDLPDNDFNTIFKSIPSFYRNLKDAANCFISGVPRSFYERLFPCKSLHLVHSCSCLHWLSQAPENIENNNSMYITRTSPPHVIEAYMKQFDKDFSRFLQLRSEEIVSGGHMVLTFVGRSIPDPYGSHCALLELLSNSLIDLIHEGLIEQAKLDSFNFPIYTPYKDEVVKIVQTEGSFDVDTIKFFQVDWDERDNDDDVYSSGKHIARSMRAVLEQMLVSHFELADSIVDYLFERCVYHLASHLLVQKGNYFNIVISLTKK